MKKHSFLLALCLCGSLVQAQDTILKNDQTEVSVKVTEITTDEVKFKYFNRLDGPTYTLKKSDVFVIIYKDGTREKFAEAVVKPTPSPTSSYVQQQAIRPDPGPATTVSTSSESRIDRKGWMWNVGYTTPLQAFGEASGITYGSGYYILGPGRKGGVLFDVDVMNFFGEGSPNYGILAANGIFRTSESSSFYLGGGLGYATVSVKLKDRFGNQSTFSSGDLGAKAFIGFSYFRIGFVWPSLGSTGGGSLVTASLCTNPFK